MTFEVPILLLICDRPLETEKVFNRIKLLKPKHLYISQDGKHSETFNKIHIDWSCNFHYRQSTNKQGCKNGVLSGLDWFFSNVEAGIILEDDTLPDLSFFYFCREMLIRYKHDKRIFHINGTNFQSKWIGNGTYYFSQNMHCWGWASWCDRWQKYSENFDYDLIPNSHKWLIKYLKKIDKLDTWDYQWYYSILSNGGICIYPNINMVENIGFNNNATHTKYGNHKQADRLFEVKEPIKIEYKADRLEYRKSQIEKYRNLVTKILGGICQMFHFKVDI